MDRTGISGFEKGLRRLAQTLNIFGVEEKAAFQSKETKKIEKNLEKVTKLIKEAFQQQDPFICIEVEKYCVNFERAFFATNELEQRRYDKQLSELQSAKASVKLVFDPKVYRQHVEEAYGPQRKIMFPPTGEACITVLQKQIQQLARPKTGIISPTIKDFYSARQACLRVARTACIEAQCKALDIPVPKQGKTQGLEL